MHPSIPCPCVPPTVPQHPPTPAGIMEARVPMSSALALLEDTRDDFDAPEDALLHVAAETNLTFSALRSAYHSSRRGRITRHGQYKLSGAQEEVLISVAQAFSMNNVALSVAQIRELVQRKWGVRVSRQWVDRFVDRHRGKLSTRTCKALADKRAGNNVLDGVVDVCEELTDFLSNHSFSNHAVFNYDETRVVQMGDKLVLHRIEAAKKERANVRSTMHQRVASLLTFVAADGSVLLSLYILKGRFGDASEASVNFTLENAPRVTRGTWPRF